MKTIRTWFKTGLGFSFVVNVSYHWDTGEGCFTNESVFYRCRTLVS